MARKEKKYHFIYKTTNQINGKYYVGMHSTDDLNDGYIGSGKKLWYSIKKYGRENFEMEILEYLPNRSSLKAREIELVNESLLNDTMCMNLKIGGDGGCFGEAAMAWSKAGIAKRKWLFENDPNFRKEVNAKTSVRTKKFWESGKFNCHIGNAYWVGRVHKLESKIKIGLANSVKQKGEANSQFGTCWITNGTENKKIKKTEKLPEGWEVGRK